ncbi:hypothetical protein M413DRAFT_347551 [Hebeloma cylindrosporum]|uniref:Uncharacterized protein n=1 Tax=Hebeloma cylindrosporum TaxID=76867 RepID=A0A0C3BFI6_HEBCY|nr:hypothetical protein M413DRAFT_347551 [Hebeloma cylindrosporum h7]
MILKCKRKLPCQTKSEHIINPSEEFTMSSPLIWPAGYTYYHQEKFRARGWIFDLEPVGQGSWLRQGLCIVLEDDRPTRPTNLRIPRTLGNTVPNTLLLANVGLQYLKNALTSFEYHPLPSPIGHPLSLRPQTGAGSIP